MYLSTSKTLSGYKVFKSVVVRKYLNSQRTNKLSPLLFKDLNDSEQLLIIDFVIALYRTYSLKVKGY